MKINFKILLPIFFILFVNLISFGYLIFNLNSVLHRAEVARINVMLNSQTTSVNDRNLSIQELQGLEKNIFEIIIVISASILILIVLFIYYLKQYITSPLVSLSKQAQMIAERKKLEVSAHNLKRKDEIGILYRAFNEMVQILADSQKSLEKKIRDRTKDLEKSKKEALNLVQDLNKERGQLLERKATERAILSSIGDALCVIDTQGIITYVNQSFIDLTGWTEKESLGKVFADLIPSETEKGIRIKNEDRFVSKILAGENPNGNYDETVYYVRKDGSRFPVSSLVKRIVMDEKMIGAVKTFSDVTKLKDIDKAKTEFVSLAAHQLRTPISSISWYTEMLLSGDAGNMNETQRKYLSQIYDANNRMINMVRSFLNASRIEMGTMQVEKQEVHLSELLHNVVDEQRQKIEEKKIDFEFKDNDFNQIINTDKDKLRMVFQNLLSNSIKYTDSQGKISVEIKEEQKENKNGEPNNKKVLITLKDNGQGIPEKEQERIFSKLFRARNALEKSIDGSGLGLYIVKNIVDSMEGKIWFESKENKGTTFFLELNL